MKHAKEYKERRERAEYFNSYDMMYFDNKEMYHYHKNAIKFSNAQEIPGCGTRARIRYREYIPGIYVYELESYYTIVCRYVCSDAKFEKLWDGYSNTTLKHINAFREMFSLEKLSKYDWIMMD